MPAPPLLCGFSPSVRQRSDHSGAYLESRPGGQKSKPGTLRLLNFGMTLRTTSFRVPIVRTRKLKPREGKWLALTTLLVNGKIETDFHSTVLSDTPACPLVLFALPVQITERVVGVLF